jgi:hypothetical protein
VFWRLKLQYLFTFASAFRWMKNITRFAMGSSAELLSCTLERRTIIRRLQRRSFVKVSRVLAYRSQLLHQTGVSVRHGATCVSAAARCSDIVAKLPRAHSRAADMNGCVCYRWERRAYNTGVGNARCSLVGSAPDDLLKTESGHSIQCRRVSNIEIWRL